MSDDATRIKNIAISQFPSGTSLTATFRDRKNGMVDAHYFNPKDIPAFLYRNFEMFYLYSVKRRDFESERKNVPTQPKSLNISKDYNRLIKTV